MKFSIYILVGFLLLASVAQAQGIKKNKISYIFQAGLGTYTGELSHNFQTFTYKPAVGLGIAYRLNSFLSARVDANFFKLGGGHYTEDNSISFSSNNAEVSTNLVLDLIPQKKSFKYRSDIIPYLFAGIGFDVYKSNASIIGDPKSYALLEQHSKTNTTPVIPFGIGFKFKAGVYTDIYIECGYRKTFTGKLDNIGVNSQVSKPISSSDNESHITPAPVTKTAHSDGYFISSFKIVYTAAYLFKRKIQSATPQSKWVTRDNKRTWRQMAKNKKLASDKVRVAYNQ